MCVLALLVLSSAAYAKADLKCSRDGRITVFEGEVTESGEPLEKAKVEIYCKHGDDVKKVATARTDSDGLFSKFKVIMLNKCDVGDTVWMEVKYDDQKIMSEPTTLEQRQSPKSKTYNYGSFGIDVPEFSPVSLGVAVLGVTLGVAALRRKN